MNGWVLPRGRLVPHQPQKHSSSQGRSTILYLLLQRVTVKDSVRQCKTVQDKTVYRRPKWNVEVRVIGLGEDVGCAELLLLLLLLCAPIMLLLTLMCTSLPSVAVCASYHSLYTVFCASQMLLTLICASIPSAFMAAHSSSGSLNFIMCPIAS